MIKKNCQAQLTIQYSVEYEDEEDYKRNSFIRTEERAYDLIKYDDRWNISYNIDVKELS